MLHVILIKGRDLGELDEITNGDIDLLLCGKSVEIEPLSITKYQIFKVYLRNDNTSTEEQTDNKKE